MKTNYIFAFRMKKLSLGLLSALILISCGKDASSVEAIIESGNLEKIKAKKEELNKQQLELSNQIEKLTAAVEELEPSTRFALVTTIELKDTLFKHFAEVQGDVATDENIIIYPETAGVLRDVRVTEGQNVRKGQVLAVIDDGGLSSELARLETQLSLAKTTFERQARLWEQKIGSEIQYLQAKSNYEALQNSVQQMKSQIERSIVRAPFNGVIDEIMAEQGQVVSPGQVQLFRIVNLQDMYVAADVPENYLGKISEGTDVKVEIPSIGREFEGKIDLVGNTINPSNRSFNIQVSIPNEEGMIKPNQIATLLLNDYTNEEAIIVPENAVQQNAEGESIVFILQQEGENEGTAKKVIVETGLVSNNNIEIRSGLEPGQQLIVQGSRGLRDGQEVNVRN